MAGDAAGKVRVLLSVDAANFSQAMDRANGKLLAFGKTAEAAGHGTASSMQAASGAIRLLEGDITRNVRAVERFITTIPGVGKALQFAFPAVGAIAFIGVLTRVGEQIAETIKKINQMPEALRQGFASINDATLRSIDNLRVTNDKLEEQLAVLQHRPVTNGPALALDEARVKADQFTESVGHSYTALKKFLDENQAGVLAQELGKADTSKVFGKIQDLAANYATLGVEKDEDLERGDTKAADDIDRKMRANLAEMRRYAAQVERATQNRAPQTFIAGGIGQAGLPRDPDAIVGDPTALNNAAKGIDTFARRQTALLDQDVRNTADETALKKQEDEDKAAKDLYKRMQEELADLIGQYGKMTATEELAYWSARKDAFAKGSEQYRAIQMEQYRLQAEQYQKLLDGKKKYEEQAKSAVEGNDLLGSASEAFNRMAQEQQRRSSASLREYYSEVAKGTLEELKFREALDEVNDRLLLQYGRISDLTSARDTAAIHTAAHLREIAALEQERRDKLAAIDPDLSDEDKRDQARNINQDVDSKISESDSARGIQVREDQAAIYGQTIEGAMSKAIGTMVQSWTDASKNIVELFESSVNTFNDALVKIATSKNPNVSKTLSEAGRSIFGEATKKTFQAAEGYGLQALGLGGKGKMGTPGNPVYVKVVEDAAGKVGGALGKLGSALGSQSGQGNPNQKQSWWHGLLSAGLGLIPGFSAASALAGAQNTSGNLSMLQQYDTSTLPMLAGGGPISANQMAIVGEQGPELVRFGSNANVYSNRRSMAMMAGGSTHYYTIDARGTDPVLTEIRTRQAIIQAHNSAVANSQRVQAEHVKRTPARAS